MFLLKPKHSKTPCIVEEGPSRLLIGGNLAGDARNAIFKPNGNDDIIFEFRVFTKADTISPFDLAASWRAYQENLEPSTVRGAPDVSINARLEAGHENNTSTGLELDLYHYLVPSPNCASSRPVYAANLTETPRWLGKSGVMSLSDASSSGSHDSENNVVTPLDHTSYKKEIEETGSQDSSKAITVGMVESKSVGTFSPFLKQDGQRGLFVDRGVGCLRLVKSSSTSSFPIELRSTSETKKDMPAAAGAVAAAAIADQMLGQKEDNHLAIVLVGLPARGKTFTAAKLTRYLRWLGHETTHFNVGKYRRLKHGANQAADFFRADNREGIVARNEVAALAMDDMIAWLQGGQETYMKRKAKLQEDENVWNPLTLG